jgi:hypothetical protein
MGESRLGKGDEDRDDWQAAMGDEEEEGKRRKRGKRARAQACASQTRLCGRSAVFHILSFSLASTFLTTFNAML